MIQIPGDVSAIIEKLHNAGFEAYAVGGCVRDSLLGRIPSDWDITTSALPEQVKEIYTRTIDTGIKHGTVTVMLHGVGYEITSYRIDGEYDDARHPKTVSFTTSLEEDLKRRDFTINAFALNNTGEIIDMFDGLKDLKNGIIRCVGNPLERFGEDALRILRAIRFAAQLSFKIEEKTREAAAALGKNLVKISAERIQSELNKILLSCNPDQIEVISQLCIDKYILPEMQDIPSDYPLSAQLLRSRRDPYIRWAVFCNVLTVGLGENIAKQKAKEILSRLKFDNNTINEVILFIAYRRAGIENVTDYEIRVLLHLMGYDSFMMFLAFREAVDMKEYCQAAAQAERIRERGDAVSLKELAIGGRELMAAGFEKGILLGRILDKLMIKVLENPELNTEEQLMELALEIKENEEK